MPKQYYTANAIANLGSIAANLFATAPDRAVARGFKRRQLATSEKNADLRGQELDQSKVQETGRNTRHGQTMDWNRENLTETNRRARETILDNVAARIASRRNALISAMDSPDAALSVSMDAPITAEEAARLGVLHRAKIAGSQESARQGAKLKADQKRAQYRSNYDERAALESAHLDRVNPKIGSDELPPAETKNQVSDRTTRARVVRDNLKAYMRALVTNAKGAMSADEQKIWSTLNEISSLPERDLLELDYRNMLGSLGGGASSDVIGD